MKADEIRMESIATSQDFFLREIAAQLAEINERTQDRMTAEAVAEAVEDDVSAMLRDRMFPAEPCPGLGVIFPSVRCRICDAVLDHTPDDLADFFHPINSRGSDHPSSQCPHQGKHFIVTLMEVKP